MVGEFCTDISCLKKKNKFNMASKIILEVELNADNGNAGI